MAAKQIRTGQILSAVTGLLALVLAPIPALAKNGLADIDLSRSGGYPSAEQTRAVYDELDYQRAVQAYIWGQPLVGFAAMREGAVKIGIAPLELFIFDKTQQVNQAQQTGNNDVIYSFAYFDLKETGPLVFEIPAGRQYGAIFDAWQRPIEDVGDVGPDSGKGGRYLIVPPGYTGTLPAKGYFVGRAQNNQGMMLLRAVRIPGEPESVAVERLKQTKIYPLSSGAAPLKFRLMGLDDYDGLTPKGFHYFELLAQMVAQEEMNERDRVMLGMLATIGIEKNKPFAPDARLRAIFDRASVVGRAMVSTLQLAPRTPRRIVFKGTHWGQGVGMLHYSQDWGDLTQVDERAALFRYGFAMQKLLDPARKAAPVPGKGAFYAETARDESGQFLDGGKRYVLHFPKNVPAATYWSVTAYDDDDFSYVRAPSRRPNVSSVNGARANPDGSYDLYFGPTQEGAIAENWVQTLKGKGYFLLMRLYGPQQAVFDGSWAPADVKAR